MYLLCVLAPVKTISRSVVKSNNRVWNCITTIRLHSAEALWSIHLYIDNAAIYEGKPYVMGSSSTTKPPRPTWRPVTGYMGITYALHSVPSSPHHIIHTSKSDFRGLSDVYCSVTTSTNPISGDAPILISTSAVYTLHSTPQFPGIIRYVYLRDHVDSIM